jgi:hypothetical protein
MQKYADTVKPRFTNASDHEQFGLRTNFVNTKRPGWRTVSRVTNTQVVPRDGKKKKNPLPYNNISLPHHLPLNAVNSPPYRYGKTEWSFRLYLIFLVLCLSFFVIDLMVSIDFVLCCKSLNKQSFGVQERINPFYINSYGENSFGLRTFRFKNDLQERIKFVNRGLTVFIYC